MKKIIVFGLFIVFSTSLGMESDLLKELHITYAQINEDETTCYYHDFLIYDFIDELFRLKDNQENFKKLVQECNPEYFYALQGFDYFKSKRDRNIEIDVNNIELLCRSIVTNNKCNYVKFFILYSLISQIWKDKDNKHIDHFIIRQKVLNDVCTFFDKEVSSENFYNIPCEIIQKRYQNKDICHDYVNKALKEQKLSVLIFMFNFLCHSFVMENRTYSPDVFGEQDKNILEKFETYKDLKMLVQANVPMYRYLDGYHDAKGNFVSEEIYPIHLVEVAICAGNINRARILLKLLFEQDEKIELIFTNSRSYVSNEKRIVSGIFPYLLRNNASDVIKILFELRKDCRFPFFDFTHMFNATIKEVKDIIKLMCDVYKEDASFRMQKCMFFHFAVKANDIDLVKLLFEKGVDSNATCVNSLFYQYPAISYVKNNNKMMDLFIKNKGYDQEKAKSVNRSKRVDYLLLSEVKVPKEQKIFENNELKNTLITISNQDKQRLRFIE